MFDSFGPDFYDPDWIHSDEAENAYEEGYDDATNELDHEPEPEEADDVLVDSDTAAAAAVGAGFGYHMASDELEERKIAEDILKRKDKKTKEEPKRVSLKSRRGVKIAGPAPRRWMFQVAVGEKTTKDPVDYTEAEQKEILKHEGEHDFEW